MSNTQNTRVSGILLHPTSLPSPYGIGDLWKEAYSFIDFLEGSGQHLWQILPLTPTGFGDSPYQSFSAFAGQPLLVSPEHLVELGLLRVEDLDDCPVGTGDRVDYGYIIPWKTKILRMAAGRFEKVARTELRNEYQKFVSANLFWLEDYALYMSCKDFHEGRAWLDWADKYRRPTASVKKRMKKQFADDIKYYYFVQFMFHKEWALIKAYAKEKQVTIIGDIHFLFRWTALMCGRIKVCFSWIPKDIRLQLQEFRQIISVRKDSSGAILCMIGRSTRKPVTNGGLHAYASSSRCVTF